MHTPNQYTRRIGLYALLLLFCPWHPLSAQDSDEQKELKEKPSLKDTLDNQFDFSSFLIDSKGFMPIPLIITEPALGNFGGVLALTFMTPKEIPAGQSYVAPDITAAVGMYTANDSWAIGGGRIGSFPKKGIK